MAFVQSALPRPELAPFVRAYAQRTVSSAEACRTQHVPAQLEQIINLEFGVLPGIRHRGCDVSTEILIGGAQDGFSGSLDLRPRVESFAVFFWPSGWSRLFNIPLSETTNQFGDPLPLHGADMRRVWNQMGEETAFERRVAIIEAFLMEKLSAAADINKLHVAIAYIFRRKGKVTISKLGIPGLLNLRQLERLFRTEVGMSPKTFARVARFQAALDARLANPAATWLDIAHRAGYYDQMHMIHDFECLGRNTPTQVLSQMGDVRPPALVRSEHKLELRLDAPGHVV
jgi:AraC-like DNA-binding protein